MFYNLECGILSNIFGFEDNSCELTLKDLIEDASQNSFLWTGFYYFLFKTEYKMAKELLENALFKRQIHLEKKLPLMVSKRKLPNSPKVYIYLEDDKRIKVSYWIAYTYAAKSQKEGKEVLLDKFIPEDFEELYIRGLIKGIQAYKLEKQFLKKLKTLPSSEEELKEFKKFVNHIVWKLLYFRNGKLLKELSKFILVWYLADLIEDKTLFREYYLNLPNPLLEEEIIIKALVLEKKLEANENFKNYLLDRLNEKTFLFEDENKYIIELDNETFNYLNNFARKLYAFNLSNKQSFIDELKDKVLNIDKALFELYTIYKSWYLHFDFFILELNHFQNFYNAARLAYPENIAKSLTAYNILKTASYADISFNRDIREFTWIS